MNEEKLEKLRKLQPKIKHEKLKRILKHAIEGWQKSEPTPRRFGVWRDHGVFNGYHCCLLGASLLERPAHSPKTDQTVISYNLWIYYGLSKVERAIITAVFDGRVSDMLKWLESAKDQKEAKLLVKEVEKICKITLRA